MAGVPVRGRCSHLAWNVAEENFFTKYIPRVFTIASIRNVLVNGKSRDAHQLLKGANICLMSGLRGFSEELQRKNTS